MAKNKNFKIFGIILLLAIVIVSVLYFSGVLQTGVPGQFTVKSISPNIKIVRGEVTSDSNFLVNAQASGGTDKIIGEISPSAFKSKSEQETINKLNIEITEELQEVTYDIKQTPDTRNLEIWGQYNEVIRKKGVGCPGNTFFRFESTKVFEATDIHCFVKDKVGIKGSFGEGSATVTNKIKLCVNNECDSKSISNKDRDKTFMVNGQEVAKMQEVILGSTGNLIPSTSGYTAIYNAQSGWKVRIDSAYTDYLTTKNTFESSLINSVTSGEISKCRTDSCVTEKFKSLGKDVLNSKTDTLISVSNSIPGTQASSISNNQGESGAALKLQLRNRAYDMELVFTLKADWIGIEKLRGKPVITRLDKNLDINSGDDLVLTGSVKNDANTDGVFNYFLENCNVDMPQKTEQFSANEEKDFEIVLLQAGYKGKNSCELVVKDRDSEQESRKSFNINIKDIPGVVTTTTLKEDKEKETQCSEGEKLVKESKETCDVYGTIGKLSCLTTGFPKKQAVTTEQCITPLITPTLIYVIIGAIFLIILTLILTKGRRKK